ncbi:PF03691 family colicin E2 tolerance protein CbrC [Fulvivirga kasyanovii]|uniref:CbrC family protein n=1 Tax=Fulvivirga kasyanovii TaxID=396812 RepID=UPI0031DC24FE
MNIKKDLPTFKYHPDPISNGVFKKSDKKCVVCNESRGYIYTGMFYSIENIEDICPWCIKDGSAAEKYDGDFFDDSDLEEVDDDEMVIELLKRTPGFFAAQESWVSHCGDFCKIVGQVTYTEIEKIESDLESDLSRIQKELELPLNELIKELSLDQSPLWAHLFQCIHCSQYRLIANYE